MNLRLPAILATFGCVLLASCYPYDESQNKKPVHNGAHKTVTSPEQQKIQQQRDTLKQKESARTQGEVRPTAEAPVSSTTTSSTTTTQPTPPPVEEKRPEYKFANKVPGKDGFVFSPYNNKVVDVRDIPSGTLVQDPTYTGAGKGYFRVP